jgi:hypothetical protein
LIQQTPYPVQIATMLHGRNVIGEITFVKLQWR